MYQQIVCNDQSECKHYLLHPVCDICKRNKTIRIDNFEKKTHTTITTNNSWSLKRIDNNAGNNKRP